MPTVSTPRWRKQKLPGALGGSLGTGQVLLPVYLMSERTEEPAAVCRREVQKGSSEEGAHLGH